MKIHSSFVFLLIFSSFVYIINLEKNTRGTIDFSFARFTIRFVNRRCEIADRKTIRFNFHAESRRRQISTSTLFRTALTLIKKYIARTLRTTSTEVHASKAIFIYVLIYIVRTTLSRTASRGWRCILSPSSIDFPRVSSRCSRLNEVTDFQWLAAA